MKVSFNLSRPVTNFGKRLDDDVREKLDEIRKTTGKDAAEAAERMVRDNKPLEEAVKRAGDFKW